MELTVEGAGPLNTGFQTLLSATSFVGLPFPENCLAAFALGFAALRV